MVVDGSILLYCMTIMAYLHCRTQDSDPNTWYGYMSQKGYSSEWESEFRWRSESESVQCEHGLYITM